MLKVPRQDLAEGRYQWREHLGQGLGGEVDRFYDQGLERDVAVKLCSAAFAHIDIAEEARRLAKFEHPNVVRIYDLIAIDDQTAAIVMQLVKGRLLADVIGVKPPPATVRRWIDEIASALAEGHRSGIMHGDLHPANVAITGTSGGGKPIIFDFGLSLLSGESRRVPFPEDPHQPPEAIVGFQPASDYWCLGLLAAQLAVGKPLVELVGPDVLQSDARALGEAVVAASEVIDDVSLAELIRRLLEEDPALRATREEVGARTRQAPGATRERGVGMGLAAVGVPNLHTEVWRVTKRHRVEHKWTEDGTWSAWYDFDFDRPAIDVAAVSGWPEHAEVFVLDSTGRVWHRWWWRETKWVETFHDLGRPFDTDTKGITALSGAEGHLDVFVEAEDGLVANIWYGEGDWRRCEDEWALGDGWWPFST